jgi:hypothetical protein
VVSSRRINGRYETEPVNSQDPHDRLAEKSDKLFRYISEGSPEAMEAASKVLETVWSEAYFDDLKTACMASVILRELASSVKAEFAWVQKISRALARSASR